MEELTLGELVNKLSKVKQNKLVTLNKRSLYVAYFESYRGYYDQLALTDHSPPPPNGGSYDTVKELLAAAKSALAGEEFEGYKGGTYVMNARTFIWSASYGNTSPWMLSDVVEYDDSVDIEVIKIEDD